jgi:hypothetical protein
MTNYDDHIALLALGDDRLAIITETWSPTGLLLAARMGCNLRPIQVTILTHNPILN